MKKTIAALLLIAVLKSAAQPYQPTWESLDKRVAPQWFTNAKFGIFIHWGVYAVPGWCTKGNYAEWYQYGLQTNDTARQKFHAVKFGNRSYYDLANDFKAELFNPDDWAKLFEQSGAKYIVLTSKHHDGYTLWPSKEADKTWGFKWNSVDVGPKRDLIADLFKAVRKTTVRAGMYYSLYEWFNPLWKSDQKKFAAEHTWPQMKDLIKNYQPDVFWTDGDWDASEEVWKSKEFLTWLYNESVVKDKVVVNDRWGSGIRFKHAGIFTPEYQPDLDFEDHAWEESRGMGFSYGYNREEDAWDYNSTQSLVLQLIDKVSRGGNFLLDIGPDEHGKIPPVMQERLLQIGDWLKINGEAIYNTSRWKTSSQWSDGRRDYKDRSGDMLLKITVDPDPGYAVKEVFYTYNEHTNSLYALLPNYPESRKILLKNIQLPAGTKITFLSTNETAQWNQAGADAAVNLPEYKPSKIKAPYAFVLKIDNYGKFTAKPKIKVTYNKDMKSLVSMDAAAANTSIFYTTDGTIPTVQSAKYTSPFTVNTSAVVNAIALQDGAINSEVQQATVKVYSLLPSVNANRLSPGLRYSYYEDANMSLEKIAALKPVTTGVVGQVNTGSKMRSEKFGFVFEGFIKIDQTGMYDFYLTSDDGSRLFINGQLVVDNDGNHGMEEKTDKAFLQKGLHPVRILYYDSGGGNGLALAYALEGRSKQPLAESALFH